MCLREDVIGSNSVKINEEMVEMNFMVILVL